MEDTNKGNERRVTTRYRMVMGFFIIALILSGITAFPLVHEIRMLSEILGPLDNTGPGIMNGLRQWIEFVRTGIEVTNREFPFMAYGTDWLAFGHIAIAIFFIGPFLKPKESRGVLLSGMVACIGIIPLAMICGAVREIPIYWRILDCCFGIIGIVPLLYCYRLVGKMNK